jgi:hypothetical protein
MAGCAAYALPIADKTDKHSADFINVNAGSEKGRLLQVLMTVCGSVLCAFDT